jgi:DNA-binding transcriptional regulator YiaG
VDEEGTSIPISERVKLKFKKDELLSDGKGIEMLMIAKFVKEKRKSVGLTQEEFANRSGVALTVVKKIEQGKSNLGVGGLLTILSMFGCTLDVKKNGKDN